MSERKVLNKYYPPDFDPTKIPKLKRPKDAKRGVFTIRIMAPFNMRCNTCGEYIYKGKKFNSRKENVDNDDYLGLYKFRFYIKCPRCIAEIAFKTDPLNADYELEAGATRNFEASRTAERMALEEQKAKEAEEANNPMKVLENRTKASCQEMEMLETLEDLRELRHRHAAVNTEQMLELNRKEAERSLQKQEQEDEAFVKSVFGQDGTGIFIKRIDSDDDDDDNDNDPDDNDDIDDDLSSQHSAVSSSSSKMPRLSSTRASDILTEESSKIPSSATTCSSSVSWNRSIGTMKSSLSGLVRPKTSTATAAAAAVVQPAAGSSTVSDSSDSTALCSSLSSNDVPERTDATSSNKTSGLLGLAAYSSSSGDSDNSGGNSPV